VPLAIEILTPSRLLLQEQVDEVNVPGADGYVGVLPGHTALLTTLGQGVLMYRKGEQRQYMALFGGYMEVNGDKVMLLADLAEKADEIDRPRAEAARERAEERLRRRDIDIDYERAQAALMRSLIRLQTLGHHA
jgi:F-type H+-transporting ATPase subunit epsilon